MAQTEPSPLATNPRRFRWRRPVQFRLRTLLIVMAIAAVALGWWSYKAERQRRAVDVLYKSGAWVAYTGPIRHALRGRSHFTRTFEPATVHWLYRVNAVWLVQPASDNEIAALRALDGPVRLICAPEIDDFRLRTELPNCTIEPPPVFNFRPTPAVQGLD